MISDERDPSQPAAGDQSGGGKCGNPLPFVLPVGLRSLSKNGGDGATAATPVFYAAHVMHRLFELAAPSAASATVSAVIVTTAISLTAVLPTVKITGRVVLASTATAVVVS